MKREMKIQISSCRECRYINYNSTAESVEYWCSKSNAKTGKQDYDIECIKPLDRMFENCTVWEEVTNDQTH